MAGNRTMTGYEWDSSLGRWRVYYSGYGIPEGWYLKAPSWWQPWMGDPDTIALASNPNYSVTGKKFSTYGITPTGMYDSGTGTYTAGYAPPSSPSPPPSSPGSGQGSFTPGGSSGAPPPSATPPSAPPPSYAPPSPPPPVDTNVPKTPPRQPYTPPQQAPFTPPPGTEGQPARSISQESLEMPGAVMLQALQNLGGTTNVYNPFVSRMLDQVAPGLPFLFYSFAQSPNDPAQFQPFVENYMRALAGTVGQAAPLIQLGDLRNLFQNLSQGNLPLSLEIYLGSLARPEDTLAFLRRLFEAAGYTAMTPALQEFALRQLNQAFGDWQRYYLYQPVATPANLAQYLMQSGFFDYLFGNALPQPVTGGETGGVTIPSEDSTPGGSEGDEAPPSEGGRRGETGGGERGEGEERDRGETAPPSTGGRRRSSQPVTGTPPTSGGDVGTIFGSVTRAPVPSEPTRRVAPGTSDLEEAIRRRLRVLGYPEREIERYVQALTRRRQG